ncbi:MAG: pyridoxal phosphate-dependent aminotransferase [Nitrososphaerota archaeon]|jgi:aspartate/methionine/tyrosine aminotransferase|nr:pyridoxal phosphate-dependent aminotransferase [Nitrososphaerota archaeon]
MPDAVHLEFGEPDFDTPDNIKVAAIEAIRSGKTKYASSAGIPELRTAVAEKMKRDNKIDYDPKKEIVITAGATAGINLALLATMDGGEEILVPDPGWATYVHAVNITGAKPVPYQLREEANYALEKKDLSRLITDRTKAILLNSPSNPTGSILSRKTLMDIAEFAVEHDLFVLSDEVYEKFLYRDGSDNEHVSIASLSGMKDRVVTINAFSKTYSMTGWRIGYVGASEPIAAAMTKINAAASSCVSTINQYAGLEALIGPQDSVGKMISAFAKRRDILVKGLNEFSGFKCPTPRGAFYTFPNVKETGMTSDQLAMKIIDEAHVAVVPGSSFGKQGEGYLRIAYANSAENIQNALARMKKIMN